MKPKNEFISLIVYDTDLLFNKTIPDVIHEKLLQYSGITRSDGRIVLKRNYYKFKLINIRTILHDDFSRYTKFEAEFEAIDYVSPRKIKLSDSEILALKIQKKLLRRGRCKNVVV